MDLAPDGSLYVSWVADNAGSRDVFVARSTDGGQSFGGAVQLDGAEAGAGASGAHGSSDSGAGAGSGSGASGVGGSGASGSGGAPSFEGTTRVDSGDGNAEAGSADVDLAPDGSLYVSWVADNAGSRDVFVARSTDGDRASPRPCRWTARGSTRW